MSMMSQKMNNSKSISTISIIIISLLFAGSVSATGVFDLLRIDPTSRGAALGGYPVAMSWYGGLDALLENPAGLAGGESQHVSTSYGDHPLDMSSGVISYGRPLFQGYGAVAVSNFNYGDFDKYSGIDAPYEGSFTAGEIMLSAGYGITVYDEIAAGISGKFINGRIDDQQSNAIALDAGIYAQTGIGDVDIAATISNIGTQTSSFAGIKEELPSIVRFGMSKRLAHLPLRLSATIHLEKDEDFYGTASGEFTISPILKLLAGYTTFGKHYKNDSSSDSFAGVSGGFGINWQRIQFNYSFQSMGAIGQVHRLGVGMAI